MTQNALLDFQQELAGSIPRERLIDDPLMCLALGTDASFYRLTPQLVVQVESIDEMRLVMKQAQRFHVAVTFRAAGTSLSGQAVTDSVLVTLGRNWQACNVREDGASVSMQPGVIGATANRLLAPLQRKIGPDPASINTAKIGGIAANNASGMCCGTANNSYHTLQAMKLVLADGTLLDTGDELSRDMFRSSHSAVLDALGALAHRVGNNPALAALIRRKYRLKNTTGYGINALLDFSDPIDMLQHLMIGSEGTLGFIAEISLRTVHQEPCKATGLLVFTDLEAACHAVTELESSAVAAVELIDRKGLAAVAHMEGMPPGVAQFPPGASALLIEISAPETELLQRRLDEVLALSGHWRLLGDTNFTTDRCKADQLWSIRKGLFPAVGAVREVGTTVIIEDVAFPVSALAAGVAALHALLEKHGYSEAVMFGHALQGNLHFVFTQSFEQAADVERYARFMDELAQLVAVKHQGSLKAEHGTGRNMAPYVELEWGQEAYQVMHEIKALLDPNGILNPGVILNHDPHVHIQNLKPMPAADDLVDRCIECGFCEPSCPSRDLSLTPRQRITSWREIQRLEARADADSMRRQATLLKAYNFAGTDTCAACGLCELRCPVGINTGDLTRAIRGRNNRRWQWLAEFIARHFAMVLGCTRLGLGLFDLLANVVGRPRLGRLAGALHKSSGGLIPLWRSPVRAGRKPCAKFPAAADPELDPDNTVIYFPACPGRVMDPDLAGTITTVLERAGFGVIIPAGIDGQCCGMPFASKGFPDIAADKGAQLQQLLKGAAAGRTIPVICDASPCKQQLARLPAHAIDVQDAVTFLHQRVLPRLTIQSPEEQVALHITCSSQRTGSGEHLQALAEACARQVIVPDSVACCGFAGDKGFTLPQLNASALSGLAEEIPTGCNNGYSNSRTCEIGLSDHAGIPYRHIAYLLLEAS